MCCVYVVVCSCYSPCSKNKFNIAIGLNYHNNIQTISRSLICCKHSYVLFKRVEMHITGEIA